MLGQLIPYKHGSRCRSSPSQPSTVITTTAITRIVKPQTRNPKSSSLPQEFARTTLRHVMSLYFHPLRCWR